MFYYFECSNQEVSNWLKVGKELGWDSNDYISDDPTDHMLLVEPNKNWMQSVYNCMPFTNEGQKLSLKELMELIVNRTFPKSPKLYFKDLEVGDKFYFNDPDLDKHIRIKCKGSGPLLHKDVYIHTDTYEIEQLYHAFINTEVIKVD